MFVLFFLLLDKINALVLNFYYYEYDGKIYILVDNDEFIRQKLYSKYINI